jgi:hypothetical protein
MFNYQVKDIKIVIGKICLKRKGKIRPRTGHEGLKGE